MKMKADTLCADPRVRHISFSRLKKYLVTECGFTGYEHGLFAASNKLGLMRFAVSHGISLEPTLRESHSHRAKTREAEPMAPASPSMLMAGQAPLGAPPATRDLNVDLNDTTSSGASRLLSQLAHAAVEAAATLAETLARATGGHGTTAGRDSVGATADTIALKGGDDVPGRHSPKPRRIGTWRRGDGGSAAAAAGAGAAAAAAGSGDSMPSRVREALDGDDVDGDVDAADGDETWGAAADGVADGAADMAADVADVAAPGRATHGDTKVTKVTTADLAAVEEAVKEAVDAVEQAVQRVKEAVSQAGIPATSFKYRPAVASSAPRYRGVAGIALGTAVPGQSVSARANPLRQVLESATVTTADSSRKAAAAITAVPAGSKKTVGRALPTRVDSPSPPPSTVASEPSQPSPPVLRAVLAPVGLAAKDVAPAGLAAKDVAAAGPAAKDVVAAGPAADVVAAGPAANVVAVRPMRSLVEVASPTAVAVTLAARSSVAKPPAPPAAASLEKVAAKPAPATTSAAMQPAPATPNVAKAAAKTTAPAVAVVASGRTASAAVKPAPGAPNAACHTAKVSAAKPGAPAMTVTARAAAKPAPAAASVAAKPAAQAPSPAVAAVAMATRAAPKPPSAAPSRLPTRSPTAVSRTAGVDAAMVPSMTSKTVGSASQESFSFKSSHKISQKQLAALI